MYEDKTYENVMEEMLERVRDDVDKREGSIIWDAVAAVSYKLAEMFFLLDNYPDLIMPDTTTGEYMDRTYAAFGLARKDAVKAIRRFTASTAIDVGSQWKIQDVVYTVTKSEGSLSYLAECEQAGSIGNQYSGEMTPVNDFSSATVTMTDIVSPGSDAESDDDFRSRFYNKVRKPSTSGNANDYYNWTMECNGVGAAKVIPLADGAGTVKILITDAEMGEASSTLINDVKAHVESVRPIGATITVSSATEKAINVTANVQLASGIDLDIVQEQFRETINYYLQENTFDTAYISMAKIGNILIDIDGVEDYDALKLNGTAANVQLAASEIAVIGTVVLGEM